jgi:enoyl-CoA hydratase
MTFVRLGIHPGMAATWTLPRLVGPSAAADLLYTGRLIGADEALSLGIANRIAGDDFDAVVDELAGAIAAAAPVAVRETKQSLRDSELRSLDAALAHEASVQTMTFTTEDAGEGIRAMREKRAPAFRGR